MKALIHIAALISLLIVAGLLAGCGTFDGLTFENHIACTVNKDKAVVVSEYGGWLGISSTIAESDREVICK